MRYTLSILIGLFFMAFSPKVSAQAQQVSWETAVEKLSDTEYELVMTASIIEHWHLYTTNIP